MGCPLITGVAVRSLATCRSVLGQGTDPTLLPVGGPTPRKAALLPSALSSASPFTGDCDRPS